MREYALDRLAEHDKKEAWLRRSAEHLARIDDHPTNLLIEEVDNWRAAMAWALATGDAGSLANRLADASGRIMGWEEALNWLEMAATHPGTHHDPRLKVRTLIPTCSVLPKMCQDERFWQRLPRCWQYAKPMISNGSWPFSTINWVMPCAKEAMLLLPELTLPIALTHADKRT